MDGSPRIHAELRAQGITSLRKRRACLMRARGLCAKPCAHRTRTTNSEPGGRIAPNLLHQDFTASSPNEKWTGDLPAVWTIRGVGGWALAAHQDETLIETAFRLALLGRHPPAGLLFHAD